MPFHSNQARLPRIVSVLACFLAAASARSAATYKQPGFTEKVVFTGLTNPTVVRFLPDGRVLVAEKSGLIKMFDSLTDTTATIVADLRTNVHNFWDRGLLGLAVPPGFDPASPDPWRREIYVLYTHDALIGATAPKWGVVDGTSDPCPSPPTGPGPTTDGCVVSGRLSRLLATGPDWADNEQVLLEDWCQQYPSHATGALDFGADEKLYVSGGDGASFNNSDWGQYGGTVQVQGNPGTYYTPANPCADPPFPLGTPQTKPTAEGGALRSQSPRRTAGEPRLLNGAILRVDPWTGDPLPDNPLFASTDENEQRIIAYGLRNPFRTIVKPGTNEVFVADVGWGTWEELNRVPDFSTVRNFGWPCFEGNGTQYTGLNICPAQGQTTAPLFTYNHSASAVAGDGCTTGSSSIAGMAFYQGGSNYPGNYDNALFFSDYSRRCMWVMFPDGGGNPDPATRAAFASSVVSGPVDLQIGPDGNLYYVDFNGGTIVRVVFGLNAIATATSPTAGPLPLTISFDGTGSQVAGAGDTLTYAWDLDGDGQFDDSTAAQPSFNYTTAGTFAVRLRVTDNHGGFDVSDPIPVHPGNSPPTATIVTPSAVFTWKVGDTVAFSGSANDPETGALAATALSWEILIHHCPSDCHTHTYQTFPGVAGSSFAAPDHEYPAYLEIRLTATDPVGLTNTASVSIQPQTVDLSFETNPTGLDLNVGITTSTAPFVRTVIVGSLNGIDAPSPQGGFPDVWEFASWSDAGAQSHSVTAPASPTTYTATFLRHADLGVGMTAAPEPVGAGANLTYTVTVSNAGPSQAASLSVNVTLPSGSSLVSASGSGWSCSGTGPVTCTRPSLAIASAPAISVVVTAPPEAGTTGNTASVTSAIADPATGNNNTVTSSNVFARADLSVTQSGAPASICTGQPIAYTLNVSNAGPSTATSVSVSDTLPAGASLVSATGTGWACSGTTTVTCTRASLAVGAAPPITVTINAPASPGTAVNTAAVSSSVNDPSAANNSSSVSTTVNAVPSPPAAGNGGAVCVGGTLQLTASAVAGATYAWTGPNGFTSSQQNPTISGVTLAAAGTYGVTVTVASCTSTAATTVATVRALPTASVSGGGVVCAGGSASIQAALTGTGPWSVVWSDGVTQNGVAASPATRSVSPGGTTTYSVTSVSDAHCAGGAGSGSALVTVRPLPTATVSGAAEICAGSATPIQATLTGTGPWTVVWSDGFTQNGVAASPATRSVSPGATTTYTVASVSDANCAGGAGAGSALVTVDPRPTAVASGTAAICAGGATPLSGSGGVSCLWAPATGLSNAASCTPTASPAATTVYTLTVTSADGCVSTNAPAVTVTVTPVPPAPTASNNGPVCAGELLQLSATGAPGASYSWTGPNGFTSNAQNPTIPSPTTAASGNYSVTVSLDGCESAAAATSVLVRPLPTATVSGSATVCEGGSTEVSAVLTGTGPWTLVWSDGVVHYTSTSPADRTVSPASTTTYTVTSVTDAHCASVGTGSAEIVVGAPVDPPTITAPLSAAVGATGLAASVAAHAGSTYAWTLAGGSIASGQGTAAVTFDAGAPGTTMELSVVETNTECSSPAAARRVQVDFLDVPPPHVFHDFVNTIARNGVTAGCGDGNYCPDASNTRAQMAVFLLKSKFGAGHVPPAAVGLFADVPAADPFAPWIEEAAALQITVGCGGGNFCPATPVTRGQMAVFLLKTLLGFDYVPPDATGTLFGDVPQGAFAADWIEDLYNRGITGGCQASPLMYCPATPVTRGQMAVFLTKTFGLE